MARMFLQLALMDYDLACMELLYIVHAHGAEPLNRGAWHPAVLN